MKNFFFVRVSFVQRALDFYHTIRPKKSIVLHSATQRGRYSFVLFSPSDYIKSRGGIDAMEQSFAKAVQDKNLLSVPNDWNIPFIGGVAGLVSYEENGNLIMGVYDIFLVEDTSINHCFLAGWFDSYEDFQSFVQKYSAYDYTCRLVCNPQIDTPFVPTWSKEVYAQKFKNCQAEMEAGNSFQINLSQEFTASFAGDSWEVFCAAVQKNPASMMAFWEDSSSAVISCSPERLYSLSKEGGLLTQPIAGTRKRGVSFEEDEMLSNELRSSVKEISEHSMLVDLLRNDFGKVAEYGSVRVSEFARVEKYATVMHLVSDITARLQKGATAFYVFRALHPGGTITGAPKKETMEILSREESSPRGFYCGSAVYFSYNGASDASIMIRTLTRNENRLIGRAGGGVIVGADPEFEYLETRHKFAGIEKIFTIQ